MVVEIKQLDSDQGKTRWVIPIYFLVSMQGFWTSSLTKLF